MPFEKSYDEAPKVTTPPCIYLRNKAMYVRGTVGDAERYPDESGAGYCWCNQTQHVLGPDSLHVTRAECVPTRDCYRETY
jgi:hypothetical protein